MKTLIISAAIALTMFATLSPSAFAERFHPGPHGRPAAHDFHRGPVGHPGGFHREHGPARDHWRR